MEESEGKKKPTSESIKAASLFCSFQIVFRPHKHTMNTKKDNPKRILYDCIVCIIQVAIKYIYVGRSNVSFSPSVDLILYVLVSLVSLIWDVRIAKLLVNQGL